jgi:xanthine dehydrogenase molybdenum-binding subunit
LRQIVSQELQMPADNINVEVWDTDAVQFDTGVGGSRVTRVAGKAVVQAVGVALREAISVAADLLDWPADRLALEGSSIVRRDTGESRSWADLLQQWGRPVVGRASVLEPNPASITSFTAQVAEVSVDPETGQVDLLRFTTAHDIGRVLNPLDHQGQIDGAVVQSIGYALTEALEVEEGRVNCTNLGEYKMPTIRDIPELRTALLEPGEGPGPYGAKGIGENPLGPAAPAIANAVADAVGARVKSLPITSERVYRALAEG